MNTAAPKAIPAQRSWTDTVPWVAFGLFIVLTGMLVPRHELWRDESADWLYTRWGISLADVLHHLGYQMDPGGWHTALYFLAKVFPTPLAMQIFHSLMAIGGVFLFIRYAPFSRLEKCLYPFGYFVFFEYNIIARNYVPILLFLAAIAVVYEGRFSRPWRHVLLIFLLAHSHMFGTIFASTLTMLYGIELLARHRFRWREYRPYVLPLLALGAGFAVSLYQMFPFAEARENMSGGGDIDYFQTTRGILLHWVAPVIKPQFYFWPVSTVSDSHSTLLALVYLIGILYVVHPRPVPLAYFAATGGIYMYMLVFKGSNPRFIGMLFVLLIFTLWLGRFYPYAKRLEGSRWLAWYPRIRRGLVVALLTLQAVSAPTVFWLDYHYPFSGGKETAQFLNEEIRGTNVLMGSLLSYASQSIQPYLRDDLPALYCLETQEFYRGLIHNLQWYQNDKKTSPNQAIQRLQQKAREGSYDRVFLITLLPLQTDALRVLGVFPADGRVLSGDERFFVHEMDKRLYRGPMAPAGAGPWGPRK